LARNFYSETPYGTWCPKSLCHGKEVLLLGSGSGVEKYRDAIESYISKYNPLVMALNTQSCIRQDLIDVRVACHPIRLLSDSKKLISFKQPLIVPVSMLPDKIKIALSSIELLDYGLAVEPGREELMYEDKYCVLPASLVASYALAVVSSGGGSNLLLAGFDGYDFGDPRQAEMNHVFYMHQGVEGAPHILSVTPTTFNIDSTSVYAILQ